MYKYLIDGTNTTHISTLGHWATCNLLNSRYRGLTEMSSSWRKDWNKEQSLQGKCSWQGQVFAGVLTPGGPLFLEATERRLMRQEHGGGGGYKGRGKPGEAGWGQSIWAMARPGVILRSSLRVSLKLGLVSRHQSKRLCSGCGQG